MENTRQETVPVELTHGIAFDGKEYGPGKVDVPRALAIGLGVLLPDPAVVRISSLHDVAANPFLDPETAQKVADALREQEAWNEERDLLVAERDKALADRLVSVVESDKSRQQADELTTENTAQKAQISDLTKAQTALQAENANLKKQVADLQKASVVAVKADSPPPVAEGK